MRRAMRCREGRRSWRCSGSGERPDGSECSTAEDVWAAHGRTDCGEQSGAGARICLRDRSTTTIAARIRRCAWPMEAGRIARRGSSRRIRITTGACCRAWAWGASRIVDYLETDPSIDKNKLIITGVSRTGKAALIAGAFDDRWAMVAPVASSGGGTPAYRYSGSVPDRGGKEGLDRDGAQISQLVFATSAPVLGTAGQAAVRRALVHRAGGTAAVHQPGRRPRPEREPEWRVPIDCCGAAGIRFSCTRTASWA